MEEGQWTTAPGPGLEIALLEAAPTRPQEARQVFLVLLLASSLSHLQVLLAGKVPSHTGARPRSVFWGCGAFHNLREALQGKSTSALCCVPQSTMFQSLHPLPAHVPPALPALSIHPALLPLTG